MLTSALVTRILEECGGGWTRTRALEILNQAQNELLAGANQLMRVKPDPYFGTTDATYSYNGYTATGSVTDVRLITDIYSLASRDSLSALSPLIAASTREYRRERTRDGVTTRAIFDCTESVRSYNDDAGGSYDCSVRWWLENNPGTTTATWRAVTYKWPTQLTAESVALSIPADFQDNLLLWGVLKRTERREYGRNDFTRALYEERLGKFKAKYLYMPSVGKETHVYPEMC